MDLSQPVPQLTDGRVKRLICRQICLDGRKGVKEGHVACSYAALGFSIVQPSSHFDLIRSELRVIFVVQASAKRFFLGCVTCVWVHGSHATLKKAF